MPAAPRASEFTEPDGGSSDECVCRPIAVAPCQVDAYVAILPRSVACGLATELEICGEACRYDIESQRAFCFRLEAGRLIGWTWRNVTSYEFASNLLSLAATQDGPLSESVAREIYVRAASRNVRSG